MHDGAEGDHAGSPAVDALALLRLQAEWGADEALDDVSMDRFVPAAAPPRVGAVQAPARPRPAQPALAGPTLAGPALAGIDGLDGLHAAMHAFDGCALRATATHTVRPDGNAAAGLLLIGDAPGADDDRSGQAFSGPPGQVLDQVLRSIGLDRSGLLLAPLVPWRPPGNRPLAEAEIQACLPFLLRLIALVRPRRLILLGAAPVRVLTGSAEPIRRLRGRWIDAAIPGLAAPVPALPMPPLDQWFRNAATKRDLWNDLLQLARVATTA